MKGFWFQIGGGNDDHKGYKITTQTLEINIIINLNDAIRMEMVMKVKKKKKSENVKHGKQRKFE